MWDPSSGPPTVGVSINDLSEPERLNVTVSPQ